MRMKINPDNLTEAWFTYDQREPTENDHDFGADFNFYPNQENNVIAAVSAIEKRINNE